MFSLAIIYFKLAAGFHTGLLVLVSLPANGPRSAFHRETDFDGYLPVMHLSLVNVSAGFDHLEPAQVLDRFVRALNGLSDGVSIELVEVPVSSISL